MKYIGIKIALGCVAVTAAMVTGPGAVAQSRPVAVEPEDRNELQWAASVVKFIDLQRQGNLGGKLFGVAGGDPAMNGVETFLGFYESPADGWRIFRLGDFLDFRILSEQRGRMTLEVRENFHDGSDIAIRDRRRRILVTWTVRADDVPTSVTIAPAR